MTDSGPLDILVKLRDRAGQRNGFANLSPRLACVRIGGITVRTVPPVKRQALRPEGVWGLVTTPEAVVSEGVCGFRTSFSRVGGGT